MSRGTVTKASKSLWLHNAYYAASFRDKRSAAPLSSLRNTNSKRQRTNDPSRRIKTSHPLTLRAAME